MSATNAALMKSGNFPQFSSSFPPFMPSQLLSISINVTINDKKKSMFHSLINKTSLLANSCGNQTYAIGLFSYIFMTSSVFIPYKLQK